MINANVVIQQCGNLMNICLDVAALAAPQTKRTDISSNIATHCEPATDSKQSLHTEHDSEVCHQLVFDILF